MSASSLISHYNFWNIDEEKDRLEHTPMPPMHGPPNGMPYPDPMAAYSYQQPPPMAGPPGYSGGDVPMYMPPPPPPPPAGAQGGPSEYRGPEGHYFPPPPPPQEHPPTSDIQKVRPPMGMGMSSSVPPQPPSADEVSKIEAEKEKEKPAFNPIMKLNIAAAKKIARQVDD